MREKELKKRASKCFTNPTDALIAFKELVELRDSKENNLTLKKDKCVLLPSKECEGSYYCGECKEL